jgi:hypothetical protein
MRRREDLQGRFESCSDEVGGLVAWDQKRGVFDVWLNLSFGSVIWPWWILFEQDEQRRECITVRSLVVVAVHAIGGLTKAQYPT